MVFASLSPARETYMLWRRFRMPTKHGSKDAVAVELKVGNELLAAYTFMLEHIVLLIWSITVLIGLVISIQKYAHDHPSRPLSKKIWRKRASPFSVLKLAFKHFRSEKSTRWLIIPWLFIAVVFIVVKYTIPSMYLWMSFLSCLYVAISPKYRRFTNLETHSTHLSFSYYATTDSKTSAVIFAPYIQIGTAAPVRPDNIFVPSLNGTAGNSPTANSLLIAYSELQIPSAFRAVGSVDSVMTDKSKKPSVSISQGEILQTLDNGEPVMQFGYEYNVTGVDLGLQNHPNLMLSVEGSCFTDYSWWNFSVTDPALFPGAYVDVYFPFNDPNPQQLQPVSKYDGGSTLAHFVLPAKPITDTNTTWGAIISSVNRTSYSSGSDPWYLTGPNPLIVSQNNPSLATFMVMPQRPALSCWENDVWSYRGHMGSIQEIGNITGIGLGIQRILFDKVVPPVITTLGSYLGASSLASSSTADGGIFDAGSSSIFNDLQRLVFASYIATVNTMTETTLYSPHTGFLNDLAFNCPVLENNKATSNCQLLEGTAGFVIFSNDVVTLSVRSLIIIPTIAIGLWATFLTLMFLPIPGKLVVGLSPERKTETEPEKQEIDDTEPEILPNLHAAEAQEPQMLRPKTAVSHEVALSESPTVTILQTSEAELKKAQTAVTYTKEVAKKTAKNITEKVVDHTSDIINDLRSIHSDINSIQESIKDSIDGV